MARDFNPVCETFPPARGEAVTGGSPAESGENLLKEKILIEPPANDAS